MRVSNSGQHWGVEATVLGKESYLRALSTLFASIEMAVEDTRKLSFHIEVDGSLSDEKVKRRINKGVIGCDYYEDIQVIGPHLGVPMRIVILDSREFAREMRLLSERGLLALEKFCVLKGLPQIPARVSEAVKKVFLKLEEDGWDETPTEREREIIAAYKDKVYRYLELG